MSCKSIAVMVLLGFSAIADAKPVIRHLQYRAESQTLTIAGSFGSSSAEVRLDDLQLKIASYSDTLIEVQFDSTAAPWHGDVVVSDATGESDPRRVSLYWLYFKEVNSFSAGTPVDESRRFEAWVAMPVDIASVVLGGKLGAWLLEPLPISKISAGYHRREYSDKGDVYTSGSAVTFLLPGRTDWSFGIWASSKADSLTVLDANLQYTITTTYPSGGSQTSLSGSPYKSHPILLDSLNNFLKGSKYYNYDPPDPRLDHQATWRQDSVLSPALGLQLDVHKLQFVDQIHVFPNPAHNWISIDLPQQSPIEITIIDQLGRIRKQTNLNPGGNVDIDDLSIGPYLLRLPDSSVMSFMKK